MYQSERVNIDTVSLVIVSLAPQLIALCTITSYLTQYRTVRTAP